MGVAKTHEGGRVELESRKPFDMGRADLRMGQRHDGDFFENEPLGIAVDLEPLLLVHFLLSGSEQLVEFIAPEAAEVVAGRGARWGDIVQVEQRALGFGPFLSASPVGSAIAAPVGYR